MYIYIYIYTQLNIVNDIHRERTPLCRNPCVPGPSARSLSLGHSSHASTSHPITVDHKQLSCSTVESTLHAHEEQTLRFYFSPSFDRPADVSSFTFLSMLCGLSSTRRLCACAVASRLRSATWTRFAGLCAPPSCEALSRLRAFF